MKNIVFLIVVAVLIGLQAAYLLTIYKSDRAKIVSKQAEVDQTTQQLAELEQRLENAEETKKQLDALQAQKTAMYNTVPVVSAHQKEELDIIRYLQLNTFYNVKFVSIQNDQDQVAAEKTDTLINQHNYEVTFDTTYDRVESFIDNLNKAYQIVNINSFSLNNDIQDGLRNDEEKLPIYVTLFGREHLDEIVTATVQFSLYSRPNQEKQEEIYIPSQDVRINAGQPFARRQTVDSGQGSVAAFNSDNSVDLGILNDLFENKQPENNTDQQGQTNNTSDQGSTPPSNLAGGFMVNVGDILTSGDTYSISGPGGTQQSYVGIVSDKDVTLTIEVQKDGYKLTIENQETGDKKETQVAMQIGQPSLNINSTMRKIQEVMPNVRINVKNYTSQVMNITLSGSLTENISIYNEAGELVTKGQTKGNIKLT